jgi:hypothetical protein
MNDAVMVVLFFALLSAPAYQRQSDSPNCIA